MDSDLDECLEQAIRALGACPVDLSFPDDVRQELDFTFTYDGHITAVEIEKTNREKILRDVLKCHMYLHFGADFAVIALAKNYPHKLGMWNLFGERTEKEHSAFGKRGQPELQKLLGR